MKAAVFVLIYVALALTSFIEARPQRGRSQRDAGTCHPSPQYRNNPQYLIGYGSLMQTESKNRTAPNTGDSYPVEVKGYRREWNAQGVSISASTTYLGVVKDPRSSFNAVVFELPIDCQAKLDTCQNILLETLGNYDAREEWYCRHQVPAKDIVPLLSDSDVVESFKNAHFWIYVNKPEFTAYPSNKYPIVQSYVDIFVSGCLEQEDKFQIPNFTDKCIQSTNGWTSNWVNDRLYPRRPFIYQPKAGKIDKALNRNVAEYFNPTNIE